MKKYKDMSEEEKQEAEKKTQQDIKKFAAKADSVVGNKIRTGFKWLKRIGGILFLIIAIPVLLSQSYVLGSIFAGLSILLLAGGFGGAKIQKAAFCLVFIGAGVGFSIYGYHVLQNAKASAEWPAAKGIITVSKVVKSESTTGTGTNKRRTVTYNAKIHFKYPVKGKSYTSNNVTFGQSTKGAGVIVSQYPTGKKVNVFYNPQDPKVAVLEPGVSTSSYLFLGFGILFSLMGLIFLIRFVRA